MPHQEIKPILRHVPPPQSLRQASFVFALYIAGSTLLFAPVLTELYRYSLGNDFCSYILLIPFISAFLLWLRKDEVFAAPDNDWRGGFSLLNIALILAGAAQLQSRWLGAADYLSWMTLALVIVWLAGFLGFWGRRAFQAGLFPLMFLFLTIPFPVYPLERCIFYLQAGSTAIAYALFSLFAVPVFRHQFLLYLPGLTIHVARECSSIRSSQALVITALLAGYYFLRSPWRRGLLVALALPLSILKNGIRIVTLGMLALRVNRAFMYGRLHHEGGILFFLLALLLIFPILFWLRKTEPAFLPPASPARLPELSRN